MAKVQEYYGLSGTYPSSPQPQGRFTYGLNLSEPLYGYDDLPREALMAQPLLVSPRDVLCLARADHGAAKPIQPGTRCAPVAVANATGVHSATAVEQHYIPTESTMGAAPGLR